MVAQNSELSLGLMMPVRKTVANAANVDEVADAFCFVVGFVCSELRTRAEGGDGKAGGALLAVEAAWETYKREVIK